MSEGATPPPAALPSAQTYAADTTVGLSVLLTALAVGLALWAVWLNYSTFEQYRERTDLDMPDWFVINFDLTVQVLLLGGAGSLCLLVAGVLFLGWAGRAGWFMRGGFVVQWLVSAAAVALVVLSRLS